VVSGLRQRVDLNSISHETKFGGVKVLDPTTIDPLGAAERRTKREKKGKKGFGLW